jgi:predicted small integral membrane protein
MQRVKFWLKIAGLFLVVLLVAACALVWWIQPGQYHLSRDMNLPATFRGDRIFVEPITTAGVKLNLLTDTGGGLMLGLDALQRCGIQPKKLFGMPLARLPEFEPAAWIPEPTGAEKWITVTPPGDADGMLGQRWFAGGVWTFDYPGSKLVLRATPFTPTMEMLAHALPLGFRKSSLGYREQNHPRIIISVAGEPLNALFDTGATVWLSAEALKIIDPDGSAERATCFINSSTFEHWHQKNPAWRIIEHGCARTGAKLIEVPQVEIAGLKAGPVWFTERGDGDYLFMSRFMDKAIVGAVGANLLRHFQVTVDYPSAVAYFECDPRKKQ